MRNKRIDEKLAKRDELLNWVKRSVEYYTECDSDDMSVMWLVRASRRLMSALRGDGAV